MKRISIKDNRKAFTLAELLVVVAIIAVVASIGIPIFNTGLEKSKEAADLANIRSAYEIVKAAAILEEEDAIRLSSFDPSKTNQLQVTKISGIDHYAYYVASTQDSDGWTNSMANNVAGISIPNAYKDGSSNGWIIHYYGNTGQTTIEATTIGE